MANVHGMTGAPGVKVPRARCICRRVCWARSSASARSAVFRIRKAIRRGETSSYSSENALSSPFA